jgi:homogentisate phytyltransferase/homogentisate geranylgeranyltransferase
MSRPPLAVRRASPRAAAWALRVLWRFGRPHTLIGTSLSIVGLYVIAASLGRASNAADLLWTVLAGLCVNVFITGINQIEDVEIDRLNKPWLPIAAGDLSLEAARRIVAIGWAYSCPPLRLKRYPALAAGSITFVRSLVVNLGVWLHVAGTPISAGVWALIAVTVPFSFAIAVLKDVPDIEGDRRFGIATLSVRLGPRPVLAVGVGALTLGGLGMAVAGPLLLDDANAAVLVAGHLLGLAALWRWALRVDPADPIAFADFYQRVWQLFFCEYLLVPLAYLVG